MRRCYTNGFFNGTNVLSGQTNTTLRLSNVQAAEAGGYTVG